MNKESKSKVAFTLNSAALLYLLYVFHILGFTSELWSELRSFVIVSVRSQLLSAKAPAQLSVNVAQEKSQNRKGKQNVSVCDFFLKRKAFPKHSVLYIFFNTQLQRSSV